MIQRELNVLILGEVPEVDGLFERPIFGDDFPIGGLHVADEEEFSGALEAPENYDLILVDLEPHGLEILEDVRAYRPVAPVVAIVELDRPERILEAERQGLERYVARLPDRDLTRDFLAQAIHTELTRFVEPPTMERPSADEMYRYAHFHNVLEPFFVVGNRRYLIYVNRAGRELVENLHDYRPIIGDDVEKWYLDRTLEESHANFDRALAGHEVVSRRELPDSDGDALHELYYQPVVDPTGRVVATTIAVHDPGRPELQRARTSQAVTRFAGGVAHQMNNLLNVLTANLELLDEQLDTPEGDAIADRIERLHHGIDRAAHLTHQMQAYSRTAVTQREALVLDEVVGEMKEQLREMGEGDIEVHFTLGAETGSVLADHEQLEMAISSLVANAVEASEEGDTVWVRTAKRRFRDWESDAGVGGGTYAVLEVEDEGDGIPEEVREQIFEPFYTTRRADEHVGLGMAIARTVVEQAGGGVEVDSAPGSGTAVRAYFPVQEHRERPGSGGGQEGVDPETPEPQRVLLIEDDPDLRESYRELLELDGYRVRTAGDVEEAKAQVGSEDPVDLVVTDVVLPDGRGTELADDLTDEIGPLPVLFVSGYGETPRDEIEGAGCEATAYLSKPFRVEALLTTVGDLLTESRNESREGRE